MDTASMYADFAQRHNKLHTAVKSLTAGAKARDLKLSELGQKISDLETTIKEDINKQLDNILKRLIYVESKSLKNEEKVNNVEMTVKEKKNVPDNHPELEKITKKMECENKSLQQGIYDLDQQISSLDDEYRSIKSIIECKKSKSEELKKTVMEIQTEITSVKSELKAKVPKEICCDGSYKCRVCYSKFVNTLDLKRHIVDSHSKKSECNKCDKKFTTSSQLETHLQEHGSQKENVCKKCGKTFHFSWRLEKHNKMHDSNITVRKCHYFNNDKQCPFDEIGCKFLHEEAVYCKYRSQCKFDKCQFRH